MGYTDLDEYRDEGDMPKKVQLFIAHQQLFIISDVLECADTGVLAKVYDILMDYHSGKDKGK